MWSYLKSDFEELFNVVKEDSHVILEKLHDTNEPPRKNDEEEEEVKKVVVFSAARHEAERRWFLEETYRVPLLQEDMDPSERVIVETYLAEFRIDDQTDQISEILQSQKVVVKEYFEGLVPHEIPYEEFWCRFFYRCDENRIQAAWDAQELAAQQARAELVGSVSNFFGGAAKSLASTVKVVVSQKDGRPPFVMNTAVDEDDDIEEEEEEELGWDDEDDEEEEEQQRQPKPAVAAATVNKEVAALAAAGGGGGENDDSADTEQIEFHDEALDKTKEELKQAVLERDLLQQTVELLKKELANSKFIADATVPSLSSVDVATVLQEKDTEIESLKASLVQMVTAASDAAAAARSNTASSPSSDYDEAAATNKIQELTEALVTKDHQYEATTKALQDEIITLRAKLVTSEAAAINEVEAMKHQMDQSSATIAALTTLLAQTQAQWELAQVEVQQLRTEVAEQRNQFNNNCQDSGDKTSEDSGVPVEAPPIVVTAAKNTKSVTTTSTAKRGEDDNEDEEDGETSDGWGDEW